MTDQEILTKAIEKAIAGGWNYLSFIDWGKNWSEPSNKVAQVMAEFYESYGGEESAVFELDRVYMMIYSHDFAKALWGDRDACKCEGEYPKPATPGSISPPSHQRGCPKNWHYETGYKYHLQQMVIADDPIKYLGENI